MKRTPVEHIAPAFRERDDVLRRAADQFGTPLYVYDANALEENWQHLHAMLPQGSTVFYSVKANPSLAIISQFIEKGAWFEVASKGELEAVRRAGASADKIIFVGPGKSPKALEDAVHLDIGVIVVESQRELEWLESLAQHYGQKVRVALRINPGIGEGMIRMSGVTQFGMSPSDAGAVLKNVSRFSNLVFIGIHGYLGTGILEWSQIISNTQIILKAAEQLQRGNGHGFRFVDVGGGFGIPYYPTDSPLDNHLLRTHLSKLVTDYLHRHPYTDVFGFESGRFLVGSAGVFVSRVLDVKEAFDKTFVVLDGGINVFGLDTRYRGARPLPMRVLGTPGPERTLTVCGPLCTTADRLAVDTLLPVPRIDDLVVFYQAGAYALTASPGLFLSHGFPAEVLIQNGQFRLVRRRMATDDLFSFQITDRR